MSYLAVKDSIRIGGQKSQNPFEIEFENAMFSKKSCAAEDLTYTIKDVYFFRHGPHPYDVSAESQLICQDVQFSLTEASASEITCYPGVEVNKFYSLRQFHLSFFTCSRYTCKDSQGNDPFEEYKKHIGQTATKDIVYKEDSSAVVIDNTTYPRTSDDGCMVIPTHDPTWVPPTHPPHPPHPTQKPTEDPFPDDDDYSLWFWIGGALVVVIVVVIIIAIVSKKNKAAKAAAQPLV